MAEHTSDGYIDTIPEMPRARGLRASSMPTGQRVSRTPRLATPQIVRASSWPASAASREQVLAAVAELEPGVASKEAGRRRAGVEVLLGWLAGFPGASWQQRWMASGADQAGRGWDRPVPSTLTQEEHRRGQLTGAIGRLILLDVIRPGYAWLYQAQSRTLYQRLREVRDRDGWAVLDRICEQTPRFTLTDRRAAYIQLARILMHNGGLLAGITLDDCVEAYRAQTGFGARLHGHWYVLLAQAGILPADSPPTIYAANRRGVLSVEEIVDSYPIACRPVRDLFVDYLHERQPGLDFGSLRQLASKLVLLFWRDLEVHEPGIDSLHLSDEVARRWKQRLSGEVRYGSNRVGQRREDPHSILMAVRAFYADLTHWALEEPQRWARWAAPSPVTARDLAGMNKQRRRSQSRMHQRIRELAPLLPTLVAAADQQRREAVGLLAAGTAAAPGSCFDYNGARLLRPALVTDPSRGGTGRPGVIYATDEHDSAPRQQQRSLTREEQHAFWTWAIVEVLRHTGLRIEEMLELTHRSFVAYTLPTTGEVIPLLQVTPSKTDRERLLVVSPELAEVLTAIISRVRGNNQRLPLVSRYDQAERRHSPPLPFLFQYTWGLRQQAFTPMKIKQLLDRLVTSSGITAADGSPARFTPHDFRRIFATEAVASGLPVHIAAKLLGHETIATTQTYIAVYDQEVIEHHRAFIARRRALRPSEEYREPSDDEWDQFLSHFEKRKVELGICGRAYGTACQHEHACVRCPMLRPDPDQQPRLEQIIANLRDRLTEAHQHGWLGEVDGLQTTIAAAEHKLAHMRRLAARSTQPVHLDPPTLRTIATESSRQ